MKLIDIAYRTLVSELEQRALDGAFSADFPPDGRFVRQVSKGRGYWYFERRNDEGVIKRRYVGPEADPEITRRVQRFGDLKDDYRARRKLVVTLTRDAGLPKPDSFTGSVVQALAAAGLFRLRAVLVGTVAFQCYPVLLGVRFPRSAMLTADTDFAQFHSVSAAVQDTVPPVLELLRAVDPSFEEVPHVADARYATKCRNRTNFQVEFLTPNVGSSSNEGSPARMPSLGGMRAQPLRFLDYLIYQPVRTVMLHGPGVSILIPAPERYCMHKLIVASRRREDETGRAKRHKDGQQASMLARALMVTHASSDLAIAFEEAWKRGPAWRAALRGGLAHMEPEDRLTVLGALRAGLEQIGAEADRYLADLDGGEGPRDGDVARPRI